ncbi:MAG: hypothetical protein LQ347_000216 [Umbilicaria vellea]|nr:MAG: hypothetical protein LQ347_000216 [Umbilicaria vellea]
MHAGFGVKKEEHIPGGTLHENLRQYAEGFDLRRYFDMDPLRKRSNRETKPSAPNKKWIGATSVASTPLPLHIHGSDSFQAPITMFAALAALASSSLTLLADPTIQSVTVVGSSKAAFDCVYIFASTGRRVDWIIRSSGHGPRYMAHPHGFLGLFRRWLVKLTSTRTMTWISPCIWGDADRFRYVRWLLHGTRWGRWAVDALWARLRSDLVA